jgi:aryl-alcohol dehydrogenase-like predicted oxidoreductase
LRRRLTGTLRSAEDLRGETDFRHTVPRFQGENFGRNLPALEDLRGLADELNATPGQLALAWCSRAATTSSRSRGRPGRSGWRRNLGATRLELHDEALERLDAMFTPTEIHGERYSEENTRVLNTGA